MKTKKSTTKPEKLPTFVQGMAPAAKLLEQPLAVVKWAKRRGCPAFRSSRVYVIELRDWLTVNAGEMSAELQSPETLEGAKLAIAVETARKLRIANELKEGRLVEREWVGSRIQRTAGDLNAFRAKSEVEHPTKFAAAAGDVASCRSIVRGIWDEIFAQLQSMSKHFEEAA